MCKLLLGPLVLCDSCVNALAQQSETGMTTKLSRELEQNKKAAWPYGHSDVFRHIIDRRVKRSQRNTESEMEVPGESCPASPLNVLGDSTIDTMHTSTEEDKPTIANSRASAFLGDCTYSDAFGGTSAAVWTENRAPHFHDSDSFASVSSSTTNSRVTQQISRPEVTVGNNSPNPTTADYSTLCISSEERSTAVIHVCDFQRHDEFHWQQNLLPYANICA